MHARQGSKTILLGSPGCGRDPLLRYVCASRGSTQRQTVRTLEGLPEAHLLITKWRLLLHELYERIGIDCDNVTLIIKRLDLLPSSVISQLLALIATGEIPGSFSLEEQIKMATRVRDERLVEIENQFLSQCTRVRQEAELLKEKELAVIKREKETASINIATFYQELERRHQAALNVKIAQAQLRYQQDCDDYTRKCEVETESVTATIMSLMRPLGITSGRWQQIVDRIRKRLRVVFFVDCSHSQEVQSRIPALFPNCNTVSCPMLSANDLQSIFYGHFHAEIHRLMRVDRFAESPELRQWEEFIVFMEKIELELPQIVQMAVDIHLAVVRLAKDQPRNQQSVPTWLAMVLPSHFARFLEHAFRKERERLAKAERFLYVHASMSQGLEKLKDGDQELHERVYQCEQQITELESTIEQANDDCDRVRDMMRRFQVAAEEQIQVTNEMEKQAQVELHVPLACLDEANAALLLIEKRHIVEIKSFNSPPLLVHLVLDAICVMFGLEPTWENARRILSDSNVVQNMLSYDKDAISDEILMRLEANYMSNERFHREEVEKQSLAASMMVIWVRAIFQYASTRRVVKPTLDKLEKAQARLCLLMQEYQASKQRMVEADDELCKSKTSLESALELKLKTTQEIESRESRLASGQLVLEFLSEDKLRMEKVIEDVERSRCHGITVWNALLSAAFVTYAGHFHLKDRQALFREWQSAYWRNTLTDSGHDETKCCVLPSLHVRLEEKRTSDDDDEDNGDEGNPEEEEDVLNLFTRSQQGERQHWKLVSGGGVCFSQRRLQDAFFLSELNAAGFQRVLLANYTHEIEELVLKFAHNSWKWRHFLMTSAKADDFYDSLCVAVTEGHQLLVLDVEPLDGERGYGNLAAVFQWETCVVDGHEQLFVQAQSDAASELAVNTVAESTTTDTISQEHMIPIHPSFRIILTSHQPYSAFGEAVVKIPTLDASIHASEVQDMLLDKLWNPGFGDSTTSTTSESASLKLALCEFTLLSNEVDEMNTQMTELIQEAAVHGDFQLPEMERLREKSNASKELRVNMLKKRMEVENEITKARKRVALASVGAVLFNAFNAMIFAGDTQSKSSVGPVETLKSPPMAFQLFLPLYFSALTSVTPAFSGVPMAPMLSASMVSGFVRNQQNQSQIALSQGSFKVVAMQSSTSAASSLNSVSQILTHMLQLLMPLVSCESDWCRFILTLISTLEENETSQHRQLGKLRPTMAEKGGTVEPLSEHKQSAEVETQCHRDNKSTEQTMTDVDGEQQATNTTICSVDTMIMLKKLHKQNVACSSQELLSFLHELRSLEPNRVVQLMIHGATASDSASSSAPPSMQLFNTTAHSRLERIQIGLTLLPHLIYELCEQMLEFHGVLGIKFGKEDDVTLPLVPPGRSNSSRAQQEHDVRFSQRVILNTKKASSSTTTKYGWLRQITALPEVSGVLIVSPQPLQSFAFVQRAFFQTIFVHEIRVAILQQLFARSFRSPAELNDVFLLPKNVFLSNATHHQALLESGADLQTNPLLVIKAFDEIRKLEMEKPDALEATPLALVNMQHDHDPAHWEGLFHILHRSYQHTTSVAFKRHTSCHSETQTNQNMKTKLGHQASLLPGTPTGRTDTSMSTVSPGNAALTTSAMRAPTTRRLSTTQSLLHRHPDVSFVTPSYPRLLALVDNWKLLPVHLQRNLLCLHDEMDTFKRSHGPATTAAAGGRTWTFKKCVQLTLLRFAFHPCRELLQSALAADESSKPKIAAIPGSLDTLALPGSMIEQRVPSIWQVLSSVVLFHALLVFRSNALVGGNDTMSALPGGVVTMAYGFDSFTTAVDQLLHCMVQLKLAKEASKDTVVLERIQQQVVLSAYARSASAAGGESEVTFLKKLHRECLVLTGCGGGSHSALEIGVSSTITRTPTSGSGANSTNGPSANLLDASGKPANIAFRRQNSSIRNLTRLTSSSFAVGGNALLSDRASLASGPRSAGATAGIASSQPPKVSSVLTFLDFPLESLVSKTGGDVDQWLDLCWNYSETLDKVQHDGQLRSLLHGCIGDRASSNDCASTVGVARAVPSWVHSLNWSENDEMASTITLADAIEFIQRVATQPAIASQVSIGSFVDSGSGGDIEAGSIELEASSTPKAKRAEGDLVKCINTALMDAFNSQVSQLRTFLSRLLAEIRESGQRNHPGSECSSVQANSRVPTVFVRDSLLAVGNQSIREQILALLQNEIPVQMRCSFTVDELSYVVTPKWSLSDLLAHYQYWRHFLSASTVVSSSTQVWFWAPALSPHITMAHAIQAAKHSYCKELRLRGVDADADTCSMSLSLHYPHVEGDVSTYEGETEPATAPGNMQQQSDFPDHTFAVFDGLCLVNAAWNADSAYLEPLDQPTNRRWPCRGLLLLCSLELSGSGAQRNRDPRLLKPRPCAQARAVVPLLGPRDHSLLFEAELPVAPALLQSLVTPFLTFAIPNGDVVPTSATKSQQHVHN